MFYLLKGYQILCRHKNLKHYHKGLICPLHLFPISLKIDSQCAGLMYIHLLCTIPHFLFYSRTCYLLHLTAGSITVTHSLGFTPNRILITPKNSDASNNNYVSAITSTTFTLTYPVVPGGTVDFDWQAF